MAAKTILSLCDYSGVWSQPYRENGYEVIQVDLAHGTDVRLMNKPRSTTPRGFAAAWYAANP